MTTYRWYIVDVSWIINKYWFTTPPPPPYPPPKKEKNPYFKKSWIPSVNLCLKSCHRQGIPAFMNLRKPVFIVVILTLHKILQLGIQLIDSFRGKDFTCEIYSTPGTVGVALSTNKKTKHPLPSLVCTVQTC